MAQLPAFALRTLIAEWQAASPRERKALERRAPEAFAKLQPLLNELSNLARERRQQKKRSVAIDNAEKQIREREERDAARQRQAEAAAAAEAARRKEAETQRLINWPPLLHFALIDNDAMTALQDKEDLLRPLQNESEYQPVPLAVALPCPEGENNLLSHINLLTAFYAQKNGMGTVEEGVPSLLLHGVKSFIQSVYDKLQNEAQHREGNAAKKARITLHDVLWSCSDSPFHTLNSLSIKLQHTGESD
eukprot:TRINITY_DN6250_c0_g1_i1.p1 TRINITY_DN6250_c0_g1~~TRINITY_DN6250_c0_g1_i1.p1  ORF type:complete len:248 (-),score=42.07 TRINITY_DN6250_c0_g1_i1:3-746(-)